MSAPLDGGRKIITLEGRIAMATQLVSNPMPASTVSSRTQIAEGERTGASAYVALAGRILFSSLFLMAAPMHFTQPEIAFAKAAGVPAASLLVPASGLLALAGALSILLGYRAKIGAWLLVLFLVPVTLAMHNFWAVHDPMMMQIQMAMFLKNVSILGGALLIAHFGAGPLSLDARRLSRVRR
jgi:putative oxidoreductase